ncbi:MAG: hypothetical protein HZC28_18780 [Spirochaetes bacterium]|nr:hypothetical protein [Spirochaetota bacterium]
MIALLLITPAVLALIALVFRKRQLNIIILVIAALVQVYATVMLMLHPSQFTLYFRVDSLNILFLAVLSLVFLMAAIYSIDYLEHAVDDARWTTFYTIFMLLFVASMSGGLLATHLGVFWISLEASTITSAVLVYYYRTRAALEATWKYLFMCSIGIALSFIGIIFISAGMSGAPSLFYDDLIKNGPSASRFYLPLAFAFLVVGFGTKMGLAPVHNWLPDAHSEAPAPVSAMLSATLLNTAFIGIIRIYRIAAEAGFVRFANIVLFSMGLMSLFVSAVFVLRVKNYKRMLAYSSIEHMGILAVALATGGAAVPAMFLQMTGHSLAKASFFLTSGTIYDRFGTKKTNEVTALTRRAPVTGWLWLISCVAICAFPPFSLFFSEFFVLQELFAKHLVITIIVAVLLTIILYGLMSKTVSMSFGRAPDDKTYRTPVVRWLPQVILLAAALVIGIAMPAWLRNIYTAAAAWVGR